MSSFNNINIRNKRQLTKLPLTDSVAHTVEQLDSNINIRNSNYSYSITNRFINALSYPVALINRNNFAVTLPVNKARARLGENALIAEVIMEFAEDVIVDSNDLLNYISEGSNKELEIIRHALNKNRASITYENKRVVLQYKVTGELLRRNDYCAHITEIDMVVCRHDSTEGVIHPYSKEGQTQIMSEQHLEKSFSYTVLINDPNNEFGDRYTNINGLVYSVKATCDYSVRPGVYVYADDVGKENQTYYSFEEADEKVPLFQTPALAKTQGDPKHAYTEQIDKIRHEHRTKMLEKEIELTELRSTTKQEEIKRTEEHAKLMHDLKMREAHLKQLESEYKRLTTEEQRRLTEQKAELDRQKHYHEMKYMQRKDTSDFAKWLPSIITAGVALVTTIFKFAF